MNIAFPAFFLLLLVLPGFIFLSSYSRSENTRLDHRAFDSSSANALVIAALLHVIWVYIASSLDKPVDFELATKLMTGVKLSETDTALIASSILWVWLYFLSIFLTSWILGNIFQKFVTTFFPYKDSFFAFDTPWYYELKGFLSKEKDAQLIELSCLCDNKDGSYLYYGILEDFYLDRDGQLDRLVLSNVYRRKLSDDNEDTKGANDAKPKETDHRYYKVRGDRLILKYTDISNINIEYSYFYEVRE